MSLESLFFHLVWVFFIKKTKRKIIERLEQINKTNNMKIRSSALGKIMTNPRSKSQTLSAGCKTYIKELVKEDLFGL